MINLSTQEVYQLSYKALSILEKTLVVKLREKINNNCLMVYILISLIMCHLMKNPKALVGQLTSK